MFVPPVVDAQKWKYSDRAAGTLRLSNKPTSLYMKLYAVLSSHYSTVQKHNSKERSKERKI